MLNLTDFVTTAEPLRCLGCVITQNGEEIGRWEAEPIIRRNVHSVTKSFTSAAVGIAVREGLLSLDEKLIDCFKDDMPEVIPDNLKKATVKDLLTMCLGQERAHLMSSERIRNDLGDWVKWSFAQDFPYEPGAKFVYNNVGPYLAGILVQRRAGCDLNSYLKPRLLDPLGIRAAAWEADPMGNSFGAAGLFLTLDELHKFGLLYLNKGKHNGVQLLPEEWVEESGKKQVENGRDGYGYLFWRGKHNSYRADGMNAQYSIIFPDKNAVVTVVSESRREREVLNAVYDHIWPLL